MALFGLFNDKKNDATIIRVDNQKVEIQEVENVSKGNKLLSAHLATNGSITISKDLNDDDGHVITALEKSKKPGW